MIMGLMRECGSMLTVSTSVNKPSVQQPGQHQQQQKSDGEYCVECVKSRIKAGVVVSGGCILVITTGWVLR